MFNDFLSFGEFCKIEEDEPTRKRLLHHPTLGRSWSTLKLISALSGQRMRNWQKFQLTWILQNFEAVRIVMDLGEPLQPVFEHNHEFQLVLCHINEKYHISWSEQVWVWEGAKYRDKFMAVTWTKYLKEAKGKINCLENIMMMMMAT